VTVDPAVQELHADSWHLLQLVDQAPGFGVLAATLSQLVDEGVPVVALTADLKYSNGLVRFAERHPTRFVQCGISEQHMVSAAAGLATTGQMPFVATFASFLALLCCEQIRTDVCYQNLPVRLIGHHAGISLGFYGTSHHATEDIAIMRSLANLTVLAPADPFALGELLRASVDLPGPAYFRIGRGREAAVYSDADADSLRIGEARPLRAGGDVTLVATGSMVHPALEAADALAADGIEAAVLDMHTIKPLDADAVIRAARATGLVVTVEEHSVIGGLGGAVAEVLAESGSPARLVRHGIEDAYSLIGPPTHLYAHYGLDGPGIAALVRGELGAVS
jgi:transketolase